MKIISVKDNTAKERVIGKKYALLMRASFKKQVSVLDKRSGLLKKVEYRVRFRNNKLQSTAAKTVNYAFVNHFGVDKERKSHIFKSSTGKTFMRKALPFKLNPKIQLEIPPEIINGFADEIAALRGDKVLVNMGRFLQRKVNFV